MISMEKREMIMRAKADGMKIDEIAQVCQVSRCAVYDLFKLVKETGDIRPRPHDNGKRPSLNQERMEELRHLLDERHDITLVQIIEEMKLEICISALSRIIRNKLNYNLRKRQYIPVNNTSRT